MMADFIPSRKRQFVKEKVVEKKKRNLSRTADDGWTFSCMEAGKNNRWNLFVILIKSVLICIVSYINKCMRV